MKFVDGWLDTADEVNLMVNSMSRQGYAPTHLALHGTAGGSDAHGVANYMGTANVSTHFVISTDGTIVQCVAVSEAAYANAPLNAPRLNFDHADVNPNYWTISIEFCKPDSTNVITITDAQFQAGTELADLICSTYNIPRRRSDGHSGIVGHCDLNSVDRAMCPGTFPWDSFFAALNKSQEEPVSIELNTPGVSQFLGPAANGAWRTTAGFHIGGAILSFYKRFGNQGLCGLTHLGLPLTEEIAVATAHPEVKIQRFERGIVAYDPHHVLDNAPGSGDVYLIHIDSGPGQQLIAAPLLQTLQKQMQIKIDALTSQLKQAQTQTPAVDTAEIATLKQQLDATTKLLTDRTARLATIASDANKLATDANQIATIAKV